MTRPTSKPRLMIEPPSVHRQRAPMRPPVRLTDEDLRRRNYPSWWTAENVGKHVPAFGEIQSARLPRRQVNRVIPKTRMTPARAQEIIRQARERANIGPWSDQIDKVLRPGEREQVGAVWKFMSGTSSFVDALRRISMTSEDVAKQAVRMADYTRKPQGIFLDPLGYLFVDRVDKPHQAASERVDQGHFLLRVEPGDASGLVHSMLTSALKGRNSGHLA